MSLHPKTVIRREVAQLLIDANTVAGARVFPSRKIHARRDELPAISIYIMETDIEVRDEAPRSLKHTVTLVVELWLESGVEIDDVDEPMDAFELQVENVLNYRRDLVSVGEEFTPSGSSVEIDPSGNRVVAIAALTYAVTYNADAPEQPAEPFEKAKATYNIGNAVDPGNQVVDCVELEGDQP